MCHSVSCVPRRVLLFSLLSAVVLLFILCTTVLESWQLVEKARRIISNNVVSAWPDYSALDRPENKTAILLETQKTLFPLNVSALFANFNRVKETTKQFTSGAYRKNLDRMMTQRVPRVDTNSWRLHSPSGRQFTVMQLQASFISSLRPGFLVPNVAHVVLPFADTEIKFYQMVDILSCIHVMKPHRLVLWYAPNKSPTGEWWQMLKNNLTTAEWEERVIMAQRPVPTLIYNLPVHVREHQSDVMRMEALLTFGGFYMDLDVLVLKPLDPLRMFSCTIGREINYGLCNGAFLSAPNGTFLAMWYTAYQLFDDSAWGDHSVKFPHELQKQFPHLCHVEEESMDRPNWTPEEVKWIYGIGQQKNWDWRAKNYVMHLWFDKYSKHHNLEDIKTLDSMYGEMTRFILYGTR